MGFEPVGGKLCDAVECAWLFEQMGRAADYIEPLFDSQQVERFAVELQDNRVFGSHDEQRRGLHRRQSSFGKIRPTAPRNNGMHLRRATCGSSESSSRACARAKK